MKKVIMLLGFAMFSMATFAAKNVKTSSISKTIKKEVLSSDDKIKIGKNDAKKSMKDEDVNCTLYKFWNFVECDDFSWYTVESVITIKICDNGSVEGFTWCQDESLLCS